MHDCWFEESAELSESKIAESMERAALTGGANLDPWRRYRTPFERGCRKVRKVRESDVLAMQDSGKVGFYRRERFRKEVS